MADNDNVYGEPQLAEANAKSRKNDTFQVTGTFTN